MEEPQEESSITSVPQSWPERLLGEEHEDDHGAHDDDDRVEEATHEVTVEPALKTEDDEDEAHNDAEEDRE